MDLIAIIFIALGLAMDVFAVSISCGITIEELRVGHALRIALFFGVFQAIMPVIGWLAGVSVRGVIASFDHWVAFGLLAFVGGKMIYEAVKPDDSRKVINPLKFGVLLLLAIATGIDALAVGLSFAFLEISIIYPVIVIGAIAFTMSLVGVFLGDRFGCLFGKKVEVIGGLILIGIGVKILVEHLG